MSQGFFRQEQAPSLQQAAQLRLLMAGCWYSAFSLWKRGEGEHRKSGGSLKVTCGDVDLNRHEDQRLSPLWL